MCRAVAVGAVSYQLFKGETCKRDVLFCYDLELPIDFQPHNKGFPSPIPVAECWVFCDPEFLWILLMMSVVGELEIRSWLMHCASFRCRWRSRVLWIATCFQSSWNNSHLSTVQAQLCSGCHWLSLPSWVSSHFWNHVYSAFCKWQGQWMQEGGLANLFASSVSRAKNTSKTWSVFLLSILIRCHDFCL